MARELLLEAELTLTLDGDDIHLVAADNYVIVNFSSQRQFDALTGGPPGAKNKPKPTGPKINPLQQVHDLVQALGLVLEIRVREKTHVTFGKGASAKITFNAVWGKIKSFFRRD